MAELRHALHALVEHPPAAPAPIEFVAARGARFERRRRALRAVGGVAVAALVSSAAITIVRDDGTTDVVLATGGPTSAGYIAEQPGGYIATGTWRLTITRGTQVIELTSSSSDHCAPTGFIQPGDEVRGSISERGSTLRAGDRFTCPSTPSDS